MALSSHVTRNFQVTIPKEIRKKLPFLKEGDPVEFHIEGNRLVLIPQKTISADQLYYWTSEWQEGVKEAKEDVKAGRVLGPYKNAGKALKDLKKSLKDNK